jgi:molecular chaperone DnaK (HSP70)
VITVPTYFDHTQIVIHLIPTRASSAHFDKAAMESAGTMAGLDYMRITGDSFAPAFACGLNVYDESELSPENYYEREPERFVLVYHLGGGTSGTYECH